MKFIHLSDLHLGKRVNEYSMLEDQEYILKKIINIIDDLALKDPVTKSDLCTRTCLFARFDETFPDVIFSSFEKKDFNQCTCFFFVTV